LDANQVNVTLAPAFEEKLLATNDPYLIYAYKNHLITETRTSFIFTDQSVDPSRNFIYSRLNIEYAWKPAKFPKDSLGREVVHFLGNNVFSQFFKPDWEFVNHLHINPANTFVWRAVAGAGWSYGNSKNQLLPFDKAFFAGGANDIRAWLARTLGPGTYKEPSIFETGDIKLEMNAEIRSALFKILEVAAFADGGNIWIRKDPTGSLPGATFVAKNIWHDSALGAGIGLRFNFTFFIFRTDFAVKLKDPVLDYQWVYSKQKFVPFKDIVPNLAIGYPF
jgi:hypothetical protein